MTERLVIGEITKPQGILGEIRVKSLCDNLSDLLNFKECFIDGEEYKILSCKVADGFCIMRLKGLADRNGAERLRGKFLEIDRCDAPKLSDGVFYIVDMIGCEIVDESGEKIGVLKDIRSAKTDIYIFDKNGIEGMFANADGVVKDIDIENKKITVNKKRFNEVCVF